MNISLYSLSYIWENRVSYCIKELYNLSWRKGVLPYLGMLGKFHAVMTAVFAIVDPIWSLLYDATNWLPLSAEKIDSAYHI